MNNFNLISAIYRGAWAIDKEIADSYLPLLQTVFQGKAIDMSNVQRTQELPVAVEGEYEIARYSYSYGFEKAPENSIALIDLKGPLMKDDQNCGPDGMATIGKMINAADKSAKIKSIVLRIDSPGGTVDGTEALAQVIMQTKKRVTAFVDGMMCSAALWIGCACDEIIASNDMDRIGSIGVMMSFADIQPALELQGVKFHSILAEQSKDKNRVFEQVRMSNYTEYRETILNPLADRFIAYVKKMRPGATDDQMTGSVFFAKDVLGSLVDGIGTLDSTFARVQGKDGVVVVKKNDEIANQSNDEHVIAHENENINVNLKSKSMTYEEFKTQHPALFAQAKEEGRKEGIKQENDRVGSYLTFMESSPKEVVKGIESGENMTQKQMAEFSVAATKHLLLDAEKKDNAEEIDTPETPKGGADDKEEKDFFANIDKKVEGLSGKKLNQEG